MRQVLVVEDGTEYTDTFGRFLPAFSFTRAGSGPAALALCAERAFDVVFLDLRFDRAPPGELLGDAAALAEERFGGDRVAARRHLVEEQGLYVLAALRAAGVRTPVLLGHDLTREPRRWQRLQQVQGPLDAISGALRPDDVAARLTALVTGAPPPPR